MWVAAFFLGTIALFLQTLLFPQFALLVYAPWVALATLASPLPKCLFLSLLAGGILDLLSEDPMGVHALNYTLVSFFLFRWRSLFLYDHPLHFSIFTFLVSFSSTLLQLFLLFLFDRRVPFAGQWAWLDLLAMPLADGGYAFLWFTLPLLGYKTLKSWIWRHFPTSP